MSDSLIVVFGGSGYLGSHIVQALAEAGNRVRVVARTPEVRIPPGLASRVEKQPANIRNRDDVRRALEGAHGAVNAVSLYSEKPPLTFDTIHVEGAERLARCCREAGLSALVHISGINADPRSPSAYVSARGRGEHRVREAFPGAIILRPSTLFGADGGTLSTMEVLCRFPVVPLFGRGLTRLQPTHVEDVAKAVVTVIANPDSSETLYELGGGQVVSYRELVRLVLRRCGRRRPMLPVPFALWYLGATLVSFMDSPPLTRDQLILMEEDNVVHPGMPGFDSLGIRPRRVDEEVPTERFFQAEN
ncbi:NADH dehydrogenase [Marinobacter daqiaonensis]|uniref:NADH dehydrogenase n=1 Tax=Marinobacter daqiaonensis TaxID=650891 RepID=A0A1I6HGY9_9GAMM|nr:complex I NDUFA9 subunit family protein [Marinobacter daqiaonensis]SFR53699.1 NADH dehydrogenase [Marinobacter daqiaonensis]